VHSSFFPPSSSSSSPPFEPFTSTALALLFAYYIQFPCTFFFFIFWDFRSEVVSAQRNKRRKGKGRRKCLNARLIVVPHDLSFANWAPGWRWVSLII
jgi:hypothetical protein